MLSFLEPVISQCADDGADHDLGRTWVVHSRPFFSPLAGKVEQRGWIAENLSADYNPETGEPTGTYTCDGYTWEAWCPWAITLCETYAEGESESSESALKAVVAVWHCWGMGYDGCVAWEARPQYRTTFSERMAGLTREAS